MQLRRMKELLCQSELKVHSLEQDAGTATGMARRLVWFAVGILHGVAYIFFKKE